MKYRVYSEHTTKNVYKNAWKGVELFFVFQYYFRAFSLSLSFSALSAGLLNGRKL